LVSSFSARFPVAHALFQIVLDSRRLGILFSCIQFTHLLDEWQKDRKQALNVQKLPSFIGETREI
jgi:hypothetical protein